MNDEGLKFPLYGPNVASRPYRRTVLVGCCILVFEMLPWARTTAQEPKKSGRAEARDKALIDGERMYRKGILPSGKPMMTTQGGASLPGTTFACTSCHTRSGVSGMGTMQGGPRTLPINATYLFQPLYHFFPGLPASEREELPARFQSPPLRPAYRDATLSRAIREGIDPNDRRFNPTMPRYALNDAEMAVLIHYLKQLSSNPSPGVTDTSMALATIITDDVSQEDRDAMFTSLDGSVQSHNLLGVMPGTMRRSFAMNVMFLPFRKWTLAHWVLKGPPESWRAQLEDFYRTEPVFALIGGLSNNSWKPIHQFCEDHQIPCILPITDLPEVSKTDYYTLYFSKGYYQEGAAVARYLAKQLDSTHPGNLVQVRGPGPDANALSTGFGNEWTGISRTPVKTLDIGKNQPLTMESFSGLIQRQENSILILWTGPESYDVLRSLATESNRPTFVFLSSTLLGQRLWDIPSEVRPFTYVSYPFREPGVKTLSPKMGRPRPIVIDKEYRKNDRRIGSRMATATSLMNNALISMERNFYRDYLLDLIDATEGKDDTDYELLNFGPGQRYLSEGCYIMRLSDGPNPQLIRISDWDEQ